MVFKCCLNLREANIPKNQYREGGLLVCFQLHISDEKLLDCVSGRERQTDHQKFLFEGETLDDFGDPVESSEVFNHVLELPNFLFQNHGWFAQLPLDIFFCF